MNSRSTRIIRVTLADGDNLRVAGVAKRARCHDDRLHRIEKWMTSSLFSVSRSVAFAWPVSFATPNCRRSTATGPRGLSTSARKPRPRLADELLERAERGQQEVEDHAEREIPPAMKVASPGAAISMASLVMFFVVRTGSSSRRMRNRAETVQRRRNKAEFASRADSPRDPSQRNGIRDGHRERQGRSD
jgi:hypothetical protein